MTSKERDGRLGPRQANRSSLTVGAKPTTDALVLLLNLQPIKHAQPVGDFDVCFLVASVSVEQRAERLREDFYLGVFFEPTVNLAIKIPVSSCLACLAGDADEEHVTGLVAHDELLSLGETSGRTKTRHH